MAYERRVRDQGTDQAGGPAQSLLEVEESGHAAQNLGGRLRQRFSSPVLINDTCIYWCTHP
jgi:hypothetical protein